MFILTPTVFLKVSNYYLVINEDTKEYLLSNNINSNINLLHEINFKDLKDNQIVNKKQLVEEIRNYIPSKFKFFLVIKSIQDDKYFAFIPVKSKFFFQKKHNYLKATILINNIVTEFELLNKNKLLNVLFGRKSDIKSIIQAISDYVFLNGFTFWIYNPYTNIFTCLVSSIPLTKDYITKNDNSSLHNLLESNTIHETSGVSQNHINKNFVNGMLSLNRIKLTLGKENEIGCLDLMSTHSDYILSEETVNWLRNAIEIKYTELQRKTLESLHNIEEFFLNYKTGLFSEFLAGLVTIISKELCFQSCSIFLIDEDKEILKLAATIDNENIGKPKRNITYSLNINSITANTFNNGKTSYSYDLYNDPKNSHTYEEATDSIGKTFIAITLKSKNKNWGLLRVKNKHQYGNKLQLSNLLTTDFQILNVICTHLSSIYELEQKYVEYLNEIEEITKQKSIYETKYNYINNFYNVFLHEIRTPISTLLSSTEIIKKILSTDLTENSRASLIKKIDDISTMGERLSFITDQYYFDEMVKPSKIVKLSLLADIILPVLNISKAFLQKQYDVKIIVNTHEFSGCDVYGDKILLNIVINSLISNAGKYSARSDKPIMINCEQDESYIYIMVSNYGLPIYDDEKDLVFENGYRGRAVIAQKIGGTGIGLYLAREIMRNQKGDLLLFTQNKYTTFKMKILADYSIKKS